MEELLAKQERTSGHIVRAVENLKRLGQANITQGVVEAKIAVLDTKWEAFVELDEEIHGIATVEDRKGPYFTKDIYTFTEDNYFLNKGKFLDMVRHYKTGEETGTRVAPSTQQLPKISIPKFSGDFTEWPAFRDLFTSMVKDSTSLSAIEKLHYLRMSLAKEPAALIASLPLTAESLQPAWQILSDRYENIRLLTGAQIANINALPPMKSESATELKSLFNGTVNAVSALRALGRPVDGYDDFLVPLTVQKLDKQSRREWESAMGSKKDPPTFAELQKFLETRICTIQALEPPGPVEASAAKTQGPSPGQPRPDAKPNARVKSHQASKASTGSRKCPLCQQDHHFMFCPSFRSKSNDERKALALANTLCLNCLGHHFVRECRSQKLCQVCKGKHHTMIHEGSGDAGPPGASAASASEGSSVQPPTNDVAAHNARCRGSSSATEILLATAIVNAFTAGGTPVPVRALLDQGSEASFVSRALAQRLSLPRASASVAITGIGGASAAVSRGRVALRLSSRLDSRFEVEIGALVLPRLTAYAPPRRALVPHWAHLDGLEFADPDFESNRRINLLLGADVFPQLLLPGVRIGPLDAPVAQNTHLGWVLSGRVAQHGETSSACASFQLTIDHALSSSLQRFWEQEELAPTVPLPLTGEEKECEEHFTSTHARTSDGRYVVRLPIKGSPSTFGDPLSAASLVLGRMEQRFSRDEGLPKRTPIF